MSDYVFETILFDGDPQAIETIRAGSEEEIRCRAISALTLVAPQAFATGKNSVSAAVRDRSGAVILAAKLSFQSTWLI